MKQIITHHGWGLDQNFWYLYKEEFQKNNWYWQDNERGYFSKIPNSSEWIVNNCKKQIRMILCHSLGFNLIQKTLLKEATHIVFINSFNNFLPSGNKRNLVLRSLKIMERKITKSETKEMLKEFIDKSFRPNHLNIDFKNIFYRSLESINESILLNDLKILSKDRNFPEAISKNCKIIFLKSENDCILNEESSNNFLDLLIEKFGKKVTLIKLKNQGHCITNLNLYKIIDKIIDNRNA